LFDFASAPARSGALERGGERLAALWREKQLQYTWLRSIQGHHADFWQVTGEALDFALESLGISDPPLRERLMDLYLSLDTFPEVPQMLTRLKEAGVKTAVLSNGSPRMLEALVEHAGLRDHLDQVISVEEVGVFKPDPRVYQLAIDRLQIPPHQISFQSSNAWDAWAASAFGMQVVWCNRYGQKPERLPGAPDREIGSLAELPRIIGLRGAETGQCSI
jgi:2-haloacid dehalogenase